MLYFKCVVPYGGKNVPMVRSFDNPVRMEENEAYAIAAYGTTGIGWTPEPELNAVGAFLKNYDPPTRPPRSAKSRRLLKFIEDNFDTLGFCGRWLNKMGQQRYHLTLKELVEDEYICPTRPFRDIAGSYTTGLRHTVLLRPTCKEVKRDN